MTSNNIEVDFVVYGNKGIKAFEIKRTARISSSMLRGLKAFHKDYPNAKMYFIYGGERHLREGNIEILPMKDVLKELPRILEH
jgi:predicted AAA+ superfamily ATPase